jgi:hypothetical protein
VALLTTPFLLLTVLVIGFWLKVSGNLGAADENAAPANRGGEDP